MMTLRTAAKISIDWLLPDGKTTKQLHPMIFKQCQVILALIQTHDSLHDMLETDEGDISNTLKSRRRDHISSTCSGNLGALG